MFNILYGFIIGHGFLDPYAFIKKNELFYYLLSILITNFLFYIYTEFMFLLFILFSMYHFGEDARYLFFKNNNLSRFFGVLLISSTIYNFSVWKILMLQLNIEDDIYIEHFKNLLLGLFCLSLFAILSLKNLKFIFFSLSIILLNLYFEPGQVVTFYLSFLHTPLAIYRFVIKYDYFIVYLWLIFSCISFILLELGYFDKINSCMILSVITTHMDCITLWQSSKITREN